MFVLKGCPWCSGDLFEDWTIGDNGFMEHIVTCLACGRDVSPRQQREIGLSFAPPENVLPANYYSLGDAGDGGSITECPYCGNQYMSGRGRNCCSACWSGRSKIRRNDGAVHVRAGR